MPAERLTMRKIREVFRQKFDCDISNRQIAIIAFQINNFILIA